MAVPTEQRRVLIVDDDVIMGELLSALMKAEGYSVTHADSGQQALTLLRESGPKPDVVLFDIQMPGMRGGELAETLQKARTNGDLPEKTALLAMSGSPPAAEETGFFDGFLRKPFTMGDFIEAVRSARAGRSGRSREEAVSPGHNGKPPLDKNIFDQLRSRLGGESLRQLYEMTLDDVRVRVGRMAAAAMQGDQPAVRQEAHTIKGSCGMVGAVELQKLAAATEGGSPFDTSALADFDSACQRLQRMLDERL